MAYTEQEQQQILKEALDPQKVQVYCGIHNYAGPTKPGGVEVKPGANCSRCWFVYYFHDIVSAPPHLRAQKLDELEEVLHKVVEMSEKGTWDFKPYRHAKLDVELN